jgi:hypothetical protein
MDSQAHTTALDEWDRQFFDVDHETLFDLILAANHFGIVPLL